MEIDASIKWGKKKYKVSFLPSKGPNSLKQLLFEATGVPASRQKVMSRGGWKGMLKSDTDLSICKSGLVISLVGTADLPEEKEPMNFEQYEREQAQKLLALERESFEKAEGYIPACQLPPVDRIDSKLSSTEVKYNRLATGLAQQQIEEELRKRRRQLEDSAESTDRLRGKKVMHLGLEMDPSYVTSLLQLSDGTLATGQTNGHVQLWKHCARFVSKDFSHDRNSGGVSCLAPLLGGSGNDKAAAFASGGGGLIKLWTGNGDLVSTLPCPQGTSPSSLLSFNAGGNAYLAAIVRPLAFPQPRAQLLAANAQQQQRQASLQASDNAVRHMLLQMASSLHLWPVAIPSSPSSSSPSSSFVQGPSRVRMSNAPLTAFASLHRSRSPNAALSEMLCGDAGGRLWRWVPGASVQPAAAFRVSVRGDDEGGGGDVVSLACVKLLAAVSTTNASPAAPPLLAVATKEAAEGRSQAIEGERLVHIDRPAAVLIVDLAQQTALVVIYAHSDAVIYLCPLPNGGLVTGGGKKDGTAKVWQPERWQQSPAASSASADGGRQHRQPEVLEEPDQQLDSLGYAFDMEVLRDQKPGSKLFALAAAKYNAVKVLI